MTSTVTKLGASSRPPEAAASRAPSARQRARTLAGLMLTLAVVSVGAWLVVQRVAGTGARPVRSSTTPAPPFMPIAAPWLGRAEVVRLEKQLVRAGYSIAVDGKLGP